LEFNKDFLQKLDNSKSLVFFTGAGISAESGIPTFRGKDGIWNKLRPEELASFDAFMKNPEMVWEWYQYRRKIISDTQPNPGHHAISEFSKHYDNVSVVTQNVDNLHRRSGSEDVYELHGNIEVNYCIDCSEPYDEPIDYTSKELIKCGECGGYIRPGVVWYGETLPQEVFVQSGRLAAQCDICFIVGTSAVVYPAASIPLSAKQSGAYLVEINTDRTEISHIVDYSIMGKSGEILPAIMEELLKLRE
jgi:NAD-dependent deacetylase